MMKNIKDLLGNSLGNALAVGSTVIPTLMFTGLVFQHAGNYSYLLPVILVLSMERAFTFSVRGFGQIINPAKIALVDLLTSMAGTIVAMFGFLFEPMWSVGAVLIGMGTSVFSPMFRTYRDAKRRNHTWESKLAIPLSFLLLSIILVVIFLLRHQHFNVVLSIYLVLQLLEFVFLYGKFRKSPDRREPMFRRSGDSAQYIVETIVASVAALSVCFYRETADTRYALWILTAYSVFFLVFALLHPLHFRDYAKRTFWYGAMRGFINLFGLVYFSAMGMSDRVPLVYVMYGLGIGVSKIVPKPLKKLTGKAHYETACIVLSLLGACLLLTFRPAIMLLGVLFSVTFASAGNTVSIRTYVNDETYPFNERHLVRMKFYSTGAITSQGVFMLLMLLVTEVLRVNTGTPLRAYLYSSGSHTAGTAVYQPIFTWTLGICLVVLALSIWIAEKEEVEYG